MKKKNEISIRSSAAEYLTFVATTGDSQESIEMRYEDENIWLTQKMMAQLYDVDVRTINFHIQKVYEDSELEERATIRNFRIVEFSCNSLSPVDATNVKYSAADERIVISFFFIRVPPVCSIQSC